MNVLIHIYGIIAGEAVDNQAKKFIDEGSPPLARAIAQALQSPDVIEVTCVVKNENMHTTHVYTIDPVGHLN